LAGLALAPVLLHTVGWRGLFYVFGLLGLPLLALWLKVVPKQTPKPRTDGQTVEKLSAVKMMSNSATWAIIAVNFVNHWGEIRSWLLLISTKWEGFQLGKEGNSHGQASGTQHTS